MNSKLTRRDFISASTAVGIGGAVLNTSVSGNANGYNGEWWPTAGSDAGNTWHSQNGVRPSVSPAPEWEFKTGPAPATSPPTVSDGVVYIGYDNGIYALDADDGSERWRALDLSVREAPSLHDETIYTVTRSEVHALDALEGSERWSVEIDGSIQTSPIISGGNVLILTDEGTGGEQEYVHALDIEDGSKRWQFEIETSLNSMTATNETLCVINQAGDVYSLDPNSGSKLWSTTSEEGAVSSLSSNESTIYIAYDNGSVNALDSTTGDTIWQFDTDEHIWSSLLATDEIVCFGDSNRIVYALDPDDGTNRWSSRYLFTDGYTSVLGLTNDTVLLGVGTRWGINYWSVSYVEGVSIEDGSTQWQSEILSPVKPPSSVDNGFVYVTDERGDIYSFDIEDGSLDWRFDPGGNIPGEPAVVDGVVYAGATNGSLYAVDVETGSEIWRSEIAGSVGTSPAVADGVIYVGTGDENLYGDQLVAVSSSDGTRRWEYETDGEIKSSPTVVDETAFIITENDLLALDILDGTKRWSVSLSGRPNIEVTESLAVAYGTVYVPLGASLVAYDTSSREILWQINVYSLIEESISDVSIPFGPVVSDRTVFFITRLRFGSGEGEEDRLYAIDAINGDIEWTQALGDDPLRAGGIAATSEEVIIVDTNGVRVFGMDGSERWTTRISGSGWNQPTIVDGVVYVPDFGDITAFDLEKGTFLGVFDSGNIWLPQDLSFSIAGGGIYFGDKITLRAISSRYEPSVPSRLIMALSERELNPLTPRIRTGLLFGGVLFGGVPILSLLLSRAVDIENLGNFGPAEGKQEDSESSTDQSVLPEEDYQGVTEILEKANQNPEELEQEEFDQLIELESEDD